MHSFKIYVCTDILVAINSRLICFWNNKQWKQRMINQNISISFIKYEKITQVYTTLFAEIFRPFCSSPANHLSNLTSLRTQGFIGRVIDEGVDLSALSVKGNNYASIFCCKVFVVYNYFNTVHIILNNSFTKTP